MAKSVKYSYGQMAGQLDYMVQLATKNQQDINPFYIFDWATKAGILVGDNNKKAVRWNNVRDYMRTVHNAYFPVELQRFVDIKDEIKKIQEKEDSNV